MRNLLRFLQRYNFQLLFLVLELLAILMLVSNNPIPHTRLFSGIQSVNAFFFEKSYGLRQYLDLKNENYLLAKENSRLRSLVSANLVKELEVDGISYSADNPVSFEFIPARVINNSINKQANYITLDKGSLSGIQPDMAVVSPDGIVGVVKSVSSHYSTVIPVLNNKLQVSVMHKKSGYFGSLNWDGRKYSEALVREIPVHVEVEIGDTIVTSGYSALFPAGERVGTVLEVDEKRGGGFKNLRLELITDFKKLSRVYVIYNRGREERINLEEQNNDQ